MRGVFFSNAERNFEWRAVASTLLLRDASVTTSHGKCSRLSRVMGKGKFQAIGIMFAKNLYAS